MSTGYMDAARSEIESGVFDEFLENPEINNIKKFTFSIGKQDFLFYGSHFQSTLTLLDRYEIEYNYLGSGRRTRLDILETEHGYNSSGNIP